MNPKQPALIPCLIGGACIGLFFGIADLLLLKMRLSWEELFLIRIWHFHLSISCYVLLWYIFLGKIIGLLVYLVEKTALRTFQVSTRRFAFLFCLIVIGSIAYATRAYLYFQKHDISLPRMVVFFSGMVLLLILCIFAFRVAPRIRKQTTSWRKAAFSAMIVFVLGSFLFTALVPTVYNSMFTSTAQAGKNHTTRPNILFIVMDTVRADHISCYGYSQGKTPHIDAFSQEGAIFKNAFASSCWTMPSHASMFTGLYPSQHGMGWQHQYLDEQFVTLAQYIGKASYHSACFTENPHLDPSMGITRGFDYVYPMYKYYTKPITISVIDNLRKSLFNYKDTLEYTRDTVDHCKSWLLRNQDSSDPFFVFLNFMAPHLPYYHRPRFTTPIWTEKDLARIEPVNEKAIRFLLPHYRLNEHELEVMRTLYDGDIAYLDEKIGELLSFMKERNLYDNTIIIITSDHGENIGDHGLMDHQFSLYNSVLHVPLLIRYPEKIAPHTSVTRRVSTVYLLQTIAELIGGNTEILPEHMEKRSLFKSNQDESIFAEYDNPVQMFKAWMGSDGPDFDYAPYDRTLAAVYEGNYKLIRSSNGKNELYETSADFNETTNLISDNMALADSLDRTLSLWLASREKPLLDKDIPKLDKDTRDALRGLGYAM